MKPDGWSELPLTDLAEIAGGGTPKRGEPSYWNGNVAWATPTDVTALAGRTIRRTASTITEAGLAKSSATLLPPGSLLLTTRATIGVCAIAGVAIATNQGFQNLVPRHRTYVDFLYYLIHFKQEATRSTGRGKYIPGGLEDIAPPSSISGPATSRAAQDCRDSLLGGRRHREDSGGHRPSTGRQARPDAGVAHAGPTGAAQTVQTNTGW